MIAHIELGLNDTDFLALTYRQLDALCERANLRRWQHEWQLAAIAAAIHNNGMKNYKTPLQPEQFMFSTLPGQAKIKRVTNPSRMTAKKRRNIANAFRAFAGVFPTTSTG